MGLIQMLGPHIDRDIAEFINKFPNIKKIPDFAIRIQQMQRAKDHFVAAAVLKDEVKLKEAFDKFLNLTW